MPLTGLRAFARSKGDVNKWCDRERTGMQYTATAGEAAPACAEAELAQAWATTALISQLGSYRGAISYVWFADHLAAVVYSVRCAVVDARLFMPNRAMTGT